MNITSHKGWQTPSVTDLFVISPEGHHQIRSMRRANFCLIARGKHPDIVPIAFPSRRTPKLVCCK